MFELPEGYTGLVVATTRRSRQWQQGLRDAGVDAVRVPAAGKDRERGSWQIGVPAADEDRARDFVRDVIEGHADLPAEALSGAAQMRLIAGVALIMLAAAAIAFAF